MTYYIDQSGKVEDTAKPTVVAYSNEYASASLILSAKDKRLLQAYYRARGTPRRFIIEVFACLLALLISKFHLIRTGILIDTEYSGHGDDIANIARLVVTRYKSQVDDKDLKITFGFVGKSHPVHTVAHRAYKTRSATDRVAYEDILPIIIWLETFFKP